MVKYLQDGYKLLKELLKTFKIDEVDKEWSQNDQNMNTTTPNLLQLVSYTHKTRNAPIRWTHTAKRIT